MGKCDVWWPPAAKFILSFVKIGQTVQKFEGHRRQEDTKKCDLVTVMSFSSDWAVLIVLATSGQIVTK